MRSTNTLAPCSPTCSFGCSVGWGLQKRRLTPSYGPLWLGKDFSFSFLALQIYNLSPVPSKRNRLRCVRCVWMETGLNASACVGKQPIMVATASTEHPIGCCFCCCSVEAVATMIGCFPTQALAFSPVSIQTQRTQRKRLRLDKNRALGYTYLLYESLMTSAVCIDV